MSSKKKTRKEELTESLKADYARWDDLYRNGGSDPFWSDGCNLWLVKNHIINDKRDIEAELQLDDYPEEWFKDLPPDVPKDYMARADDIRKEAQETVAAGMASPDYKWLKEHCLDMEYTKLTRLHGLRTIQRLEWLSDAAGKDDLVNMRRSAGVREMLDSLKEARQQFDDERREKKQKDLPLGQLSIFDFI